MNLAITLIAFTGLGFGSCFAAYSALSWADGRLRASDDMRRLGAYQDGRSTDLPLFEADDPWE